MSDNKILQAILDGLNRIVKDMKNFKDEAYKRFDRMDEKIEQLEKRVEKLGNRVVASS